MKKVDGHKSCKFMIDCGEKVYKFSCDSDATRDKWVSALINEINQQTKEKELKNLIEIQSKPKKIKDYYNLRNIKSDKLYIRNIVAEQMRKESYFAPKQLPYFFINLEKRMKNRKV